MTQPQPEAAASSANLASVLGGQGLFAPLPSLGAIRCGGAEAETFLQNQLGNDIREIANGHAQLTSYSSPKGRVLTVFLAARVDSQITLSLPRSLVEPVIKRLRMFVLRSKVELSDASLSHPAIGLAGTPAMLALEALGFELPQDDWQAVDSHALSVMRYPGTGPRVLIRGAEGDMAGLKAELGERLPVADEARWRLLDILGGLPVVHPQTQDHFVAQMLNLDRLGGISFTKGCYPGQEIVARTHYLGSVKRRMFLGFSEASAAPGTPLYSGASEQAVGEVVESAPHPQFGQALLAVMQIAEIEKSLHLVSPGGPAFVLAPDQQI